MNAPDRIRTYGLHLRRVSLKTEDGCFAPPSIQAELQGHTTFFLLPYLSF